MNSMEIGKMEKTKIMEIAQECGVDNVELFTEFFNTRFPNESNNITSYVREWAGRFVRGNPKAYMDSESLEIYNREESRLLMEQMRKSIKTLDSDSLKQLAFWIRYELKERYYFSDEETQ